MDATLASSLEQIVSVPRFARYRAAGRTHLDAVVLYCWNIQLAEALLPSLALLEVTLRNAVHDALTSYSGTEFWFAHVLQPAKYANIADLIRRISAKQMSTPTAGKVISEITFGFWPLLFAKRYNSLWWDQHGVLLSRVLPNHPGVARDTRSKFEARLEYFAVFRNRTMHHEAIFQGVAALNRPILSLGTLHDQIIETIGWINGEAAQFAKTLDRFDDAHDPTGYNRIEASIRRGFSIS